MMRPEELIVDLLRYWWVVLIAAIVAAGVAYIGTSSQPKEYTVSVRVMAIARPPDYWMDLYAKNRLASYKDLINNWQFVHDALQEAGLNDIDPSLAQSKLQLGHNPDANIVQIVVVDTEPERAAQIANALADAFVARNQAQNDEMNAEIESVEDRVAGLVHMQILERANPPTTPSGPRVKVNTLAGGLLGAVVGVAIAFGLTYRDDTLKRRTDVERYLERPVIATLPPPGQ